jgi:aminoglycoside phosphotransferase (APT) family kinase protein
MTEVLETLAVTDPLHELLCNAGGLHSATARFDVFRLSGREGAVDLFIDERSGFRAVGKYYGRKWIADSLTGSEELRTQLLDREFAHLELVRNLGFDDRPYHVPRPLAKAPQLGWLLLESYVEGTNIHHAIWRTVTHGDDSALRRTIRMAAEFLAALHAAPRSEILMPPKDPFLYARKVIGQLQQWDVIDADGAARLNATCAQWEARGLLREAKPVMIHGDATPEHFLIAEDEDRLGIIDFESLRNGDAAADLGYLAAEIKHLCWSYTGDPWSSEPFIRHVHASYARAAGGDATLTERARYFMACAEMRIGRNSWLPLDYRRKLIVEADQCWKL